MQYEAPETTKAAVGLLAKAKGSAYVLAGGSDLLVRMKGGFVEPDLVVDIKRIKAMREIKRDIEACIGSDNDRQQEAPPAPHRQMRVTRKPRWRSWSCTLPAPTR